MPPPRNRGIDLGVMMLLFEMFNVGFDQIPIVTLVTIVGQVLLYIGIINVPWDVWDVCISTETVLKNHEYKRLIISMFEHGDDLHLYYNMISFLVKGRSLETRYGSPNFGLFLGTVALLTSCMYVALGELGFMLMRDEYYIKSCAIGFSGVIFALKVVTSCEEAPSVTMVGGVPVSSKYAAWVELVLIHLLVPRASFMGHLGGILAGLVYTSTPVGTSIDNLITSVTDEPVIHSEYFYNSPVYNSTPQDNQSNTEYDQDGED